MRYPPAEWSPHARVWLAWPSHLELWEEKLPLVRGEFAELCRGIADEADGSARGEPIHVLARTEEDHRSCTEALGALVTLHSCPYGDIWLRDTGPIFATDPDGLVAHRFRFNGWGEKYELEGDHEVAPFIAQASGARRVDHDFVLEGGAIEFDGDGTLLTSRSCLLNPNRGDVSEAQMSEWLEDTFGVTRVLWIEEGLKNDHTDGHIDTLVRFVSPGVVLCMAPNGVDDPNRAVLDRIASDLGGMRDARGRSLTIHRIPSPGRIENEDGVLPASYVNFYIANTSVVVPTFGVDADADAIAGLAQVFPNRHVVGVSARALIEGGGAFHCITQQQPEVQR